MLADTTESNIVALRACAVHNFAIAVPARAANVACMKLPRYLSEHLTAAGETYTTHCLHACTFAARLLVGGLACLVHAFLPFLFVQTASKCVAQLHAILTARNNALRSSAATQRPSSNLLPSGTKMSRQPQ
jgi:hypothetical protein